MVMVRKRRKAKTKTRTIRIGPDWKAAERLMKWRQLAAAKK
jgi:hypothetical protein